MPEILGKSKNLNQFLIPPHVVEDRMLADWFAGRSDADLAVLALHLNLPDPEDA